MLDFSNLRAQWALKYQPSKSQIEMEFRSDQMANPHNENYYNKRPRREEAQIISDLCYLHADGVLNQQYGSVYSRWLKENTDEDRWTQVHREHVHSLQGA
mgnify:CR=1 FL=1